MLRFLSRGVCIQIRINSKSNVTISTTQRAIRKPISHSPKHLDVTSSSVFQTGMTNFLISRWRIYTRIRVAHRHRSRLVSMISKRECAPQRQTFRTRAHTAVEPSRLVVHCNRYRFQRALPEHPEALLGRVCVTWLDRIYANRPIARVSVSTRRTSVARLSSSWKGFDFPWLLRRLFPADE